MAQSWRSEKVGLGGTELSLNPFDNSVEQQIRSMLDGHKKEQAAKLALEEYGKELLGWLCGVCGDLAAQTIFDRFSKELPGELWAFSGQFAFRPWLYGIARKVAFRQLRSPSRQDSPLGGSVMPQPGDHASDHRTWAKTQLNHSAFARLRDQLDPEERMVLILRVDRRMSWEDVARVMENPATGETLRESATRLRRYFHRTRERLREMAIAEGLMQ